MASIPSRAASGHDKRASNSTGAKSRVASSRVGDGDRSATRDDSSPAQSENRRSTKGQELPSKKFSRENSASERRVEKTTTTTKERLQVRTRSPVKESVSAGNRRETDRERLRKDVDSPLSRKKHEEPEEVPWAPQASLVPHSTAPLAIRVSVPPLSALAPKTLQPRPLKEMSMDKQEAAIVDDLLYVFMGYEGQYIRFVDNYNPSEEKHRLAGPEYRILPGLDPSLKDLTTSMLKMATYHNAIEAFVEVQSRQEFGAVNHALCAAIRKLLKDFLILIAQLESKVLNDPAFTLHVMHLQIMPTSQSLAQLYALAQELLKKNSLIEEDLDESIDDFDADNILERLREGGDLLPGSMSKRKCIGGNVLALLTQRLATYAGDPAAKNLLQLLLREASRPYTSMLNEWLHHGVIKDSHGEFLIGERSGIRKERLEEDYTDEYWEKRYHIREREVPPQLESVKDKVLLAGKYLNVVRECGGVDISKEVKDIPRTFDDPNFLDNVNGAYAYANASLLNLLLTKNSLRSRLRSFKHYFFLDRSDFFSYFLELSASELKKPQKSVNVGKLQSLLDLVLRQPGSIAAADPFKEDVKVKMNEIGLTQWLMRVVMVKGFDPDNTEGAAETPQQATASVVGKDDDKEINGFEALELDYSVPFPLSLVISRKTVLRYQLLFRYLLSLRHLETLLVDCWSEHMKGPSWIHKSSDKRLEIWKRRAWTLRARMLVFVQQVLFFCTAEVIEPNWQKLMARVDEADPDSASTAGDTKVKRTVDELMQDHVDFLDTCMKECMLTQGKLLKIHSKLLLGCTMFATYTSSLSRNLAAADPDLAAKGGNASTNSSKVSLTLDPDRFAKMEDTLRRYEEHFSRHLKVLMDSLNYYAATETVVLLGLCARLTAAEPGSLNLGITGLT